MVTCSAVFPSDRLESADVQPLCVPIQWGNADVPPVFCVPGAGASVTSFMPLASALGIETPVYGLQPRGLDGQRDPFVNVQEAAQTYLALLKRIAPRGPCQLIGHSFGGWIAYDMARLLECEDERVVHLTLVDSRAPSDTGVLRGECRGADALAKLVEILEQTCGSSLRLSRQKFASIPAADRVHLLARAMAAAGLIPLRTNTADIAAMVRVFEANLNTPYAPASPLRGPAILVRASDASSVVLRKGELDPFLAWRDFIPGLLHAQVPGNHMTMLAASHVAALAGIVHGHRKAEPESV